jgi:hypothetical protein
MKIIILIILISLSASAQWMGGAAYQVKSSVPANGAAFYALRKLPYQGPDLGINVKGKLSYFFSDQNFYLSRGSRIETYEEYAGDVFLEATFFKGVIKPFTAIGIGGGHLTSDNYKKTYFSLNAQGGIKFFTKIQPFMELHIRRIISDFSDAEHINLRNFQVVGAIGLFFSL